ncbi:MAG: hypothetical protein J0J06_13955 [Sphingomonas sp.]|uniref:hypothetical protein n=1 Tax=Sphingomonas sp. TaxID=28214 RepID=UPI001AC112D0|nr:hypothetical protein [Sphingomonas sp.]MBN8816539.1 hypothetical protein [Sphingomonas sp.]
MPETIVTALEKDPTRNDRRRAAEIIEHPFLADFDVMVEGVRNDGDDAIVKLETVWQPLAPVPEAAWASVPRGADPRFPWRATEREVADIYRLAASGALLLQQR